MSRPSNLHNAIAPIISTMIVIAALVLCTPAYAAAEKEYVPTTLPGADILTRQAIKDIQTGFSKGVPGVCTGRPEGGILPNPIGIVPGRTGVGATPAQAESNKVQPGGRYYYCVGVQNRGTVEGTFALTTVEFVASPNPDEGRRIEIEPTSLGTWIHPQRNKVTVPPGETFEIPYAIDVPNDAPSGSLFAGIRITSGTAEGATTAIANSVIHNVFLTLPGGKAEPLEISRIDAPRVLSKKKGDLAYRARFVLRNKGTILDSWQSQLKVKGLRRTVGEDLAGPSAILPNEGQRVTMRWGKLPWIGWYKPEVTVKTRSGDQKVDVPRVLILPPMIYVVSFLLALLVPVGWIIFAWYRRRQAWMAYYAAELDREDGDEEFEDDHAIDDLWDPTARH